MVRVQEVGPRMGRGQDSQEAGLEIEGVVRAPKRRGVRLLAAWNSPELGELSP